MVDNIYKYDPDYAVIPGGTLREILEERPMSQEELGRRTGLSRKTINEILSGKAPITPETANRLEMATGAPASVWNKLERDYREQLAALAQRQSFAQEAGWAKQFPYKELVSRGVVRGTKDPGKRVAEIFRFFGVSSRETWETVHGRPTHALFRKGKGVVEKPILTATWLQLAKKEARKATLPAYNATKFKSVLEDIRKLTVEPNESAASKLASLAATAGVAVVLVKEFKGAAINGAMFWDGDRPVIALTARGKAWDKLWFNFFHEAAHLIHHGKSRTFIDVPGQRQRDSLEDEADQTAADWLIPTKFNERVRAASSEDDLIALAQEVGTHTSIIVGRYHHLTQQFTHWRHLVIGIQWAEDATKN